MNIVFLLRSVAKKNGVERTITDKVNALANMGHMVTLLTYEQCNHPNAFHIDEKVRCIDFDCCYYTIYKYPLFIRLYEAWKMKYHFAKKLQAFINQVHPDVIVTTTYTKEFMDIVISLSRQIRVVIESHTAFTHDMMGGSLIERIQKYALLRSVKRCDLLIALTMGDAECWKQHIRNVATVCNPLTFYPETLSHPSKESGRIIAVGRLEPQKRFDRLIEAFSLIAHKYPSWYIDIYGEGNDREALQRLIEEKGLTKQIYLKGVTSNVYSEYERSQFFVFSSDYEGFGLVLAEAMACSIPCVSTDCPFGPSDIIEDRVDGLLCKMTEEDLSAKMEWMIIHEKERQEMGLKARQTVVRYKKENVMKAWEKAYLSVIN
jgi:glycosyltransferase involved in cell wall biosynthesis